MFWVGGSDLWTRKRAFANINIWHFFCRGTQTPVRQNKWEKSRFSTDLHLFSSFPHVGPDVVTCAPRILLSNLHHNCSSIRDFSSILAGVNRLAREGSSNVARPLILKRDANLSCSLCLEKLSEGIQKCPNENWEAPGMVGHLVGHLFGHLTTAKFPSSFGGAENLPHMDVLAGNYLLKGVLSPQGSLCSRSFWGLQLFSLPCWTLQHTWVDFAFSPCLVQSSSSQPGHGSYVRTWKTGAII